MELEERIGRLEQDVAMIKSRVYSRNHPAAWSIAEYWLSTDETPFCTSGDYIIANVRDRSFYRIEIPHCFRCNYYILEDDDNNEREEWDGSGQDVISKAKWNRSGKYLDRAHLIDRARGGPDTVDNMVLLDHRCHSMMPSFGYGQKQDAIDWILSYFPVTYR